eukprot:3357984-Rhodomonas_salina.4
MCGTRELYRDFPAALDHVQACRKGITLRVCYPMSGIGIANPKAAPLCDAWLISGTEIRSRWRATRMLCPVLA